MKVLRAAIAILRDTPAHHVARAVHRHVCVIGLEHIVLWACMGAYRLLIIGHALCVIRALVNTLLLFQVIHGAIICASFNTIPTPPHVQLDECGGACLYAV